MNALPPSLSLGATAPDFSLADPGGRTWTLADAGGSRGTLVAFVCNHCPYVKHVAVALGEAAARWADAGVATVAINSNDAKSHPDDRPERMVEQARAWGWAFPYVVDADQVVARDYLAACTPDFFLLDAARTLVYRGRFDWGHTRKRRRRHR